nr:hypothetical protein [Tanacetum cinerariifolium]
MELDEHVPVYVLEPEHLEYHVPSDDDMQVKDQPYTDDASPIAESPGYIADSDSMDEDSIDYLDEPEDDDEDPKEDPRRIILKFFEFYFKKGLLGCNDVKFLLVTLYTEVKILDSMFDDKTSCEHTKSHNKVNNVTIIEMK